MIRLKKDCWFIAFALLVFVGQASAQSVSLMHVPDSGRTQGLIFGQGTEIVVDVSQTGMTQSVNAIQIVFEFDTSVLTLTAPTGWLLQGGDTVTLLSITAAPVPASVRFTFTTKVDVTGREFSIGIKTVTLDQVTLTPSAMVSFNTVRPQLHLDTQIESPAENNNVLTLKATEGDTVKFQLFVPDAAGYQFNAFEVELALSGKTASDYISSASSDWVSTGSGSNLVLSLLSISGVSVPSSGYMGQIDLSVTGALTSEDTLLVQSAELDGRQAIDVSNAVLTFTQVCPGDFDNNGMINIPDFLLFVDVFGTSTGDATYNALMDMDDNGMVGIPDFLLFVDVFGTTCEITSLPPPPPPPSGIDYDAVCDRTPLVRDAIVARASVDTCAAITASHLAKITRLEIQLRFNRQGLTSLQSGDFADLTNLEYLDLSENSLTDLPVDIFAGLTNLEHLDLSGRVHGDDVPGLTSLPEDVFDDLTSLKTLRLGNTALTELPADIFAGLTSLEFLSLRENKDLTSLPEDVFDGLTSLETLDLNHIGLTSLPEDVFDGLTSLETLELTDNWHVPGLTSLPEDVFDGLTSLETLNLGIVGLTSLPSDVFSGLTNLTWLRLSSNGTATPTGLTELPTDIFAGLTSLASLDLTFNPLTCLPAIPSSVTYLVLPEGKTRADYPSCSDQSSSASPSDRDALVALYNATAGANWTNNTNWLSDRPIGEWYGITTNSSGRVTYISLERNQLSGTIPPELGNLSDLIDLVLRHNQLSGIIPPELSNLTNLQIIWIQDNQLSGPVPPVLGNLLNLKKLELSDNQFDGSIPPALGNLSNLEVLYLQNNQLSGLIPPELGNLSSLHWLFLGSNQLSGSIPSQLGNLSKLQVLSLGSNQLSGSIPPELGNLPLADLRLNNNHLSGSIPSELGSLSNLILLYIHNNQLSGSIPSQLGNLSKLQVLSLGSNQLSGCIPEGLRNVPNNDFSQLGLPFCSP